MSCKPLEFGVARVEGLDCGSRSPAYLAPVVELKVSDLKCRPQ